MKRQIALMKKAGIRSFFLHSRFGLKTPYGSRKWFDLIEQAVAEAGRLGMKAWLLDEDPYNSGAAGGEVLFDHPEFAAKQIFRHSFQADRSGRLRGHFPGERVLQAVAVRRRNGRILETVDIRDSIGVLRETTFMTPWSNSYYPGNGIPFPHYRAEAYLPFSALDHPCEGADWSAEILTAAVERSDYRWGLFPDNLNPRCVEHFLALTHERYRKRLGRFFGGTAPGFFTDEIRVGASRMPYTDRLEEEFHERHGYELGARYVDLFLTRDASSFDVRRDYWETIHALLEKNCLRPMKAWCRRHGVLLTGHFLAEDDPVGQTYVAGGDIYSNLRILDIPGFDLVGSRVGDARYPAYHLGAKLAASVAHQSGKGVVLGECFACTPWNYGFTGMKRTANWLLAHGITWLNPHAFYYSIDGYRKYEAPKAFSFQDPLAEDYARIQRYAARQGQLLADTRPVADTLVLYPSSCFWRLLPAEEPAALDLRKILYQLIRLLIEARIAFDIVDEETLARSPVSGGKLRVGRQSYRALVLPLAGPFLPVAEKRLAGLADTFPVVRHATATRTLRDLKAAGVLRTEVRETGAPVKDLVVLHRRHPRGPMEFLFNNSPLPLPVVLPLPAASNACIDDGGEKGWQSAGDGRAVDLILGPYDAVALLHSRTPLRGAPAWKNPANFPPCDLTFETHPQWDYSPPQPILSAMTSWEIQAGSGTGCRHWPQHRFALARDLLGTESAYLLEKIVKPLFDTAPPAPSLYPVRMSFSADFPLTRGQNAEGCALVMESETIAGEAVILLNGRRLPASRFRRRRVYDPANVVASIAGKTRDGLNRIEIVFEKASEFDGLRGPVFVMPLSSL